MTILLNKMVIKRYQKGVDRSTSRTKLLAMRPILDLKLNSAGLILISTVEVIQKVNFVRHVHVYILFKQVNVDNINKAHHYVHVRESVGKKGRVWAGGKWGPVAYLILQLEPWKRK